MLSSNELIRGSPGMFQRLSRKKSRLIRFFSRDSNTDFATYADMVKRCGKQADLTEAKQVHSRVTRHGWERVTYMGNLLVEMFSKCGSLLEAVKAFNKIETPSIVSWTLIMMANAQNGYPLKALEFFWKMLLEGSKPDIVTFVTILDVCATVGKLSIAKAMHALVHESGLVKNTVVGNVMVNMYSVCGDVPSAGFVFKQMPVTDVISWTSMLAGYAQNGHFKEGIIHFRNMDLEGMRPNYVTFITALEVAASSSDLPMGKLLHERIIAVGFDGFSAAVNNSLINMYCKCGDLDGARFVFWKMNSLRNAISWTSILAGYTQAGLGKETLELTNTMDLEGVKPDLVTLITTAEACSLMMNISQAQRVHQRIVDSGYLGSCSAIGSSLISMYGKCGSLELARNVFQEMKVRDVVSWTAILTVHAQGGDGMGALEFFENMNMEGVRPNSSTFVSVLFASSHVGVLQDGRDCFMSIQGDYGVNLTMEHYASMVDLLARAGKLHEADELINNMPFQPDDVVWRSLLAAWMQHEQA